MRPRTYSQTGQDVWVVGEVFNEMRQGYFLEVGSADGVTLSNTYLLEKEYDWNGICIEADAEYFASLAKARNAQCVHACVDGVEREVEFAQRKLLGGIVGDGLDNSPAARKPSEYNTVKVMTKRLATILHELRAPPTIDYFSIDVEGAEERILGSFPFGEYRFNCMTIERPKAPLRQVLANNGYMVIKEIPGYDVFYVHSSFLKIYVDNVFAFWTKPVRDAHPLRTRIHRPSRPRSWWARLVG